MTEIVLIRHAESSANVAGWWQGRGDADLSPEGIAQAAALGARLSGRRFDSVVSSPLARARDTAAAFAEEARTDDDLIEIDLGGWEGLPVADVARDHGPLLKSIYGGGDDPFGETGERVSEVAERALRAIARLAEEVGPEGTGAVVTHGGVIDSVFAELVPSISRRPHRMAANASLTHLVGEPGRLRLSRFNDTAHLGRLGPYAQGHVDAGGRLLAVIRHGRTRANVEGRAQGQSCWGLDAVGEEQAQRLADWYGPLDLVFTSPLDRARSTARAVSAGDPVEVDGLKEIAMGDWEGLVFSEIGRRWPDAVKSIFENGDDLPRGGHGETWAALTERSVATLSSLDAAPGQVTGVVTHGGVIRAFVGSLGGGSASRSLATPENTSVTHVALSENGPVLCDYAVAPHLDEMAVLS